MKQGIHPDFQKVVFMDSATGAKFLAGKQKFAQADGRIEKFNKKYGLKK